MAETRTLEETIRTYLGDMTRTKQTTHDMDFTEKNGAIGTVSMAYIYSAPFRTHPEKKQFVIKRIEIDRKSKGVVTPTLKKILNTTDLTEIKIESIQNEGWIPKLAEKGWTITEDSGGLIHAIIKKTSGGRRRKSRKFIL